MRKLYTRRGDSGDTDCAGLRLSKDDPLIEAIGTIDELNSSLGVAKIETVDELLQKEIGLLQEDLLTIGAQLGSPASHLKFSKERLIQIENMIDKASGTLPPLTAFILPGGTRLSCALHAARTVCRRAERRIVKCHINTGHQNLTISYLNRMADLLFVLARVANYEAGISDSVWSGNRNQALISSTD